MLRLRIKAPFAAFRPFSAGSYRPTAPFLTPSAVYGLLLNVANIETRRDDGEAPMTLTALDLPAVEVAIGAVSLPQRQTLYQQLHNYPVGTTGKERAADTKGSKYNIQPIRRELLSDLDVSVLLRGNRWLEDRVRNGLRLGGQFRPEGKARYGLPFLGDNSLLLSVLREETSPVPAYWFVRTGPDLPDVTNLCRLTAWIDRQDASRTVTYHYARSATASADPPDSDLSWTWLPPEESR